VCRKILRRRRRRRNGRLHVHKWHKLGLDYRLADVQAPEPALTERVREQFRARGLTVY
jgi:hypothetical protein